MRLNVNVTITAGTPFQVSQLFGYNPTFTSGNWPGGAPMILDRVFIQMSEGGTGLGYVLSAPHGTIPAHTNSAQLTAQLGPASASAPGDNYQDISNPQDGGGIDGSLLWVDGSVNGDGMTISVDVRV